MHFYLIGNKSGKLNRRHKQEGAIRTSSSRTVCTRADQPRVFNSGREKKSVLTDKTEISRISEFFIFIFIFYFFVFFFNLFFSGTNIQKINFGR